MAHKKHPSWILDNIQIIDNAQSSKANGGNKMHGIINYMD